MKDGCFASKTNLAILQSLFRPVGKFLSVFCYHGDFDANYKENKLPCIFFLHCNNFWSRLEPFLDHRVNTSALEPFF